MKNLKCCLLIVMSLFLFSCEKDKEQEDLPEPKSFFEIDGVKYETPRAYLLLSQNHVASTDPDIPDPDPYFTGSFAFVFMNGQFFDGFASTNTTQAIYLEYEEEDEGEYPTIGDIPLEDLTYPLTDESNGLTNISLFEDKEMINGVEYGDVANGDYFEANETGLNILDIELIQLDADQLRGTVRVDYSFETTDGKVVGGQYEGSFEIVVD